MATADSTSPSTQGATAPILIVRNLFGEHPEDVISPINSAATALSWVEEILRTIQQEAKAGRANGLRVERLAEAGAYLAQDMGNYAGHAYETMINRLCAAGVDTSKGEPA